MEEWRDIPGYENIYQASTLGRIRTCEGKTTASARFAKRVWRQRILKPKRCKNRNGRVDERVSLWKQGREKTMLVARLVALTWCEGYCEGLTVNHIDGNTLNNAAENLEWLTRAENIARGFEDGLYRQIQMPVVLIRDGEVVKLPSLSAASRWLGKSRARVRACLQRGEPVEDKAGNYYAIARDVAL